MRRLIIKNSVSFGFNAERPLAFFAPWREETVQISLALLAVLRETISGQDAKNAKDCFGNSFHLPQAAGKWGTH
jgi:hypothetical protein